MTHVALAAATGAAAAFNPCGVGLLPSYVAFLVGDAAAPAAGARRAPRRAAVAEGLAVGAAMTVGLLALYAAVAATFGVVAAALGTALPALGRGLGLLLALWGAAIALWPARFWVSAPIPHVSAPRRAGVAGAALYGLVFGLASLGCTFPLFASLIFQASAAGSAAGGAAVVLAYGLGMGAVLCGLAVAARLVRSGLEAWLRRVAAVSARVVGAVVLLSGAFITAYWMGWVTP